MFQVLTGPCAVSELFHLSGFYWHTCRVVVGACHFLIGPCVVFLLVHVAIITHTCPLFFTRPCVTMLYVLVSIFQWTTCRALNYPCIFFYSTTWQDGFVPRLGFELAHMSYLGSYTCHSLVCPHVKLLFNDVACAGSTTSGHHSSKADRHKWAGTAPRVIWTKPCVVQWWIFVTISNFVRNRQGQRTVANVPWWNKKFIIEIDLLRQFLIRH
jgi:hypothetical protein